MLKNRVTNMKGRIYHVFLPHTFTKGAIATIVKRIHICFYDRVVQIRMILSILKSNFVFVDFCTGDGAHFVRLIDGIKNIDSTRHNLRFGVYYTS